MFQGSCINFQSGFSARTSVGCSPTPQPLSRPTIPFLPRCWISSNSIQNCANLPFCAWPIAPEAQYAWTQHVVLAQLAGVSDEQIAALQQGEAEGEQFTTKEQLALAFAGEVMQTPRLSDALFEQVRRLFSSREIVELLLVVGWYWTVGRLMTTLDIEPDTALGTQALQMLREQPNVNPFSNSTRE